METVKINIVPKGAVKAAHASQGDAPRIVRFELFDELLPYTLDGSEDITLKVVRPDTEEIVSSVTNTEEAYIDVSFTSEMTAIRGVANCEIKISKSGAEIGSHNFDLNIERDAYGEDITVETASGVIATFTTGVIDNLVSLKTTFEPKQDLHGYPSSWIDSNVVNKTPYLSRALAGTASRIGNYEFNKLVGGTYAFNQLIGANMRPSQTQGDVTYTNNGDGSFTLNGTATQDDYWVCAPYPNNILTIGHKYYLSEANNNGVANQYGIGWRNAPTTILLNPTIINCTDVSDAFMYIYKSGAVIDNVTFRPQLIDLTQMFGSTIADYIYSLETAQAGAGVSFFKSLFDKDYYAYNAGELISVKTSAHVTKDANNNVISNIALDPDLELRGIPKLDENNNLYYDGDTYESNGDVTRRYGIVDLGSINWSYSSASECFIGNLSVAGSNTGVGGSNNVICFKYIARENRNYSDFYQNNQCGLSTTGTQFIIKDTNYSDPAAFKASLSGVYLVYELATPTTESADPFTDPQEIDASGSEEFIDARAVSIPVGHESYYANICEITGIDEINLFHTGVNLFDKDNASVVTGYISASSFSDSNAKAKTICIPIKPSNTYTVSKTAGARFALAVSSVAATNGATYTTRQQDNTASHITITAGANDYYLWAWIYLEDTDTGSLEDMLGSVQIEYGDQVSEYKAYTGESALVEIGQEVYGGYYDKDLGIVLTDKLVDLGSYTWFKVGMGDGRQGFRATFDDMELTPASNIPINALCSVYPILNSNQVYLGNIGLAGWGADTQAVAIYDPLHESDTINEFKAFVNGIKVCYKLADPIIIPADAVNFETVKGVNNVWSDTNGETEVKFFVKEA